MSRLLCLFWTARTKACCASVHREQLLIRERKTIGENLINYDDYEEVI